MTTDAVGGVWSYTLELCAALVRHEVEVVLATMGPVPTRAQAFAIRDLAHVRLAQSAYRLEWMRDAWHDVDLAGNWLLALADAERVDIVHLNGYAHAALPWRRPVVVVAHSCVWTWWQAVHGSWPPVEWREYHRRVQAGLRAADGVIAPTASFGRAIARCYDLTREPQVIPNGRTARAGTQHARASTSRPCAPFVFSSGRAWDEAKNFGLLDIAARESAWPCYLAGDNEPPGMSAPSRPMSHLRLLGTLDAAEHERWLESAAVFVHPARYEPFGMSVLEAAAAGCALVLADLPTLRELWNDAALFFDADDARSLQRALGSVIDSEADRVRLASAAKRRAKRFGGEAMAAAYAQVYENLHATRRAA